jgi:hypothetical protein
VTVVTLPSDMPSNMKRLPRDEVGRPIPFFAAIVDGKHDFRVMDGAALHRAVKEELCWVCGERLLRYRKTTSPRGTFVAGPMCVINRVSAEPPSHRECAAWSARACPFLTMPKKVRREGNLPGEAVNPGGVMIPRNPGVTALIDSHSWGVVGDGNGGRVFRFIADGVTFMAEGRIATTEEAVASFDSGIPALMEVCDGDEEALADLAVQTARTLVSVFGSDLESIKGENISGLLECAR